MAQDLRRSQNNVPQTTQSGPVSRRRSSFDPLFLTSPEEFFRMNPFQLMRHFSDEMDRVWGGYSGGRERQGDETSWRPVVDVRERDGRLQIRADLPGVNENDVKVAIENDRLIIQGERKREEEHDEEGWHRMERSYGNFYRAIPLPDGAETDKATANFNNGVLEIAVPVAKAQQQQVRQIPISAGGQAARTQPAASQTGQQPNQSPPETVKRAGGS